MTMKDKIISSSLLSKVAQFIRKEHFPLCQIFIRNKNRSINEIGMKNKHYIFGQILNDSTENQWLKHHDIIDRRAQVFED